MLKIEFSKFKFNIDTLLRLLLAINAQKLPFWRLLLAINAQKCTFLRLLLAINAQKCSFLRLLLAINAQKCNTFLLNPYLRNATPAYGGNPVENRVFVSLPRFTEILIFSDSVLKS